jgi:hypothetical protein
VVNLVNYVLNCFIFLQKDTLPADGNIFHQMCGCHILNLIVQDGLSVLSDEIHNIHETMKYIRHS